jgi:NADP-dependent 3-hydroxy acid dehydrogenase YdfG
MAYALEWRSGIRASTEFAQGTQILHDNNLERKFGLIGFTQSLYEEVREHGIKVALILPGFVDTPMIPPVKHLDRSKMIQPDDVAQAVLYVLNAPATACPVEITIRPQRTPHR